MSLRKALSLFHLCIYSNSKSIFLHIKCDGKVMSLLKSGWVIRHCGKGLTLSPSQRLFFPYNFTKLHDFLLFRMYGWRASGCPCVVQGDDGWARAKGLKWWGGRVGGRETSTLQTVVQISYSSGQMLRPLVIHQVDWPRFQCLHKSVDGQFQIGQKKKTGGCQYGWEADTLLLRATAEQVSSTAVSSTRQWRYRVPNSPSMLNLYGSPK